MRRWQPWLVGLALVIPLGGLAAWIAYGALAARTAVLPTPTDYAADQLEARVDGGADALRAAGCLRLRHWRLESPPADAEALFFSTVDAARSALAREAGPGRTAGPGDEAQVSPQAVYFRRGTIVVRVFADPGAASKAAALPGAAALLDRALLDAP